MQVYKSANTKNMYIEKKSKRNKIILVVSILTIVILGAGIAYATLQNRSNTASNHTSEKVTGKQDTPSVSEDQEKEAGNQTKTDTVNPSTSPSPSTQPQNSVTIEITASNQNGSVYQLRTLINDVISGGSCNLTLTKGSAVVTKTAPIQSLAQSSTCQGFDIPVSELSKGTWNVKINLSDSNVNGSVTSTIEIK